MCGRFALTLPPEAVRELMGYIDQPNFPPRYNIAPTQPVPVVTLDAGARRFVLMRWGFLPSWVKDPKDFPLVFNIRSESAAEKPAFRNALKRRRAIMPADAFYEWKKEGKQSVPFLIRKPGGGGFGFAALWETYSAPDGSEIDTVAILTTSANATTAPIHPRSPVILQPEQYSLWLDPETPAGAAQALLRPPPTDFLEAVPIGAEINKVANDNPDVQRPAAPDELWAPPSTSRRAPRPAPAAKGPKAPPDDQGSLF
ncbi:SOS response-associated peptidase [Terrarubrum flagellatum]|uniref:SOS response-associated peptidase n=1 Tax=Terrirubrum flagellatum TaxID=2895980 RepID=UPI0031451B6A